MKRFSLVRDTRPATATMGTWREGGAEHFQTLEPYRPIVPVGIYLVELDYSPARGYAVFEYQKVPGHTQVQLHPGNTHDDTIGCTLAGRRRGMMNDREGTLVDCVLDSRPALRTFMQYMGIAQYQALTNWDLVRDFKENNPVDAWRFELEVVSEI